MSVAELLAEIREAYAAACPPGLRLRPPADDPEVLRKLRIAVGGPLTEQLSELLELWRCADGEERPGGLFFNWRWLSMGESLSVHDLLAREWRSRTGDDLDRVIYDIDPPGTVRRTLWSSGWVPFADDEAGNFLVADIRPAKNGTTGQVLAIGRDHHGKPSRWTDSVRDLLDWVLQALRDGEYEIEQAGTPGAYIFFWPPAVWTATSSVPDLAGRQWISLRVADGYDLSWLAAEPRLLSLRLEGIGEPGDLARVDLARLAGLPIEELTLDRLAVSTAALEGLPKLRLLTARDCRLEGDLSRPLGVSRLDLTGSTVGDLSPLAIAPLRVVTAAGVRGERGSAGDVLLRAAAPARRLELLALPDARVTATEPLRSRAMLKRPPVEVDLSGNPGADLTGLAGVPISRLTLDPEQWDALRPIYTELKVATPLVAGEPRGGERTRALLRRLGSAGAGRWRTETGTVDLGPAAGNGDKP